MVQRFDYLVIGSGIAGMSFALKVANEGKSVALICKAGQEEANTYFAQGGIASVTNLKVDNFEKHIEDTMIAGDWISDRAAVEKVVREAPAQIEALIRWDMVLGDNLYRIMVREYGDVGMVVYRFYQARLYLGSCRNISPISIKNASA